MDGRFAIATDTHVTPANEHDSIPYLERLDRQRARFGLDVRAVGLDASYASAPIAKGLEDRDILGVTGYLRPSKPKGMMPKRAFTYDADIDAYRCPEGQVIPYATTDRNGYRHDKSGPSQCRNCPLLASSRTYAKAQKTVTRVRRRQSGSNRWRPDGPLSRTNGVPMAHSGRMRANVPTPTA